jgi:alpha-N-acetylglucosamine transferase
MFIDTDELIEEGIYCAKVFFMKLLHFGITKSHLVVLLLANHSVQSVLQDLADYIPGSVKYNDPFCVISFFPMEDDFF